MGRPKFFCCICKQPTAEKQPDVQGWDGYCSNCGIIAQKDVGLSVGEFLAKAAAKKRKEDREAIGRCPHCKEYHTLENYHATEDQLAEDIYRDAESFTKFIGTRCLNSDLVNELASAFRAGVEHGRGNEE